MLGGFATRPVVTPRLRTSFGQLKTQTVQNRHTRHVPIKTGFFTGTGVKGVLTGVLTGRTLHRKNGPPEPGPVYYVAMLNTTLDPGTP